MRPCGACGARLEGAATPFEAGGRTWIWRCECGWAAARTESSDQAQTSARVAIARAMSRSSDPAIAAVVLSDEP